LAGKDGVELGIVSVLEHANHLALGDRDIVKVMLQCPRLNSSPRQFAGAKLGEIRRFQQSLYTRLDDIAQRFLDDIGFFGFHNTRIPLSPCGMRSRRYFSIPSSR